VCFLHPIPVNPRREPLFPLNLFSASSFNMRRELYRRVVNPELCEYVLRARLTKSGGGGDDARPSFARTETGASLQR
jgi:hypothetical protein